MELRDIVAKCKTLSVHEERINTDDYYESVFYVKDAPAWEQVLESCLGKPSKPVGVKPSKDDVAVAQKYGGIWSDQQLWKKDMGTIWIVAMFWPWQDKVHSTLKMGRLPK